MQPAENEAQPHESNDESNDENEANPDPINQQPNVQDVDDD